MRLSNPLPRFPLPKLLLSGLLPLAMAATACGADSSDVDTGAADTTTTTASVDDGTGVDGDAVPAQKLVDQEWRFTNSIVGGDAVVPVDPGVVATLRISADRVEGSAGCNTFSGAASLDEDGKTLTIDAVSITEMACEDATDWMPVLDLARVWNISVSGDALNLTAADKGGAGFDLVPLADGVDAEPKADNPLNQSIADDYVGLTEDAALTKATQDGRVARVVERDGQPLPVTLDFNPDRLNFTISSDAVTHVEFG